MARLENEEIPALPNTGERMVPEGADANTFWEHIYRYRFATRFARGKRVLDVACGEGYGSAALLKAGAASLIGIDVSPEACDHARSKYGIDARVGDAQDLPLADGSVDLVVSFETIEHVPEPGRFLDECARVLAPGGILIVSTPNRDNYRYGGEDGGSNPFHCSEMDLEGFEGMLGPRFRRWSILTQCHRGARWYSPAGLAIPSWFWWRVLRWSHLYWLYWQIRWRICGPIQSDREPTAEQRRSPLETISHRESSFADLFNPVAVHAGRWYGGEEPSYFLAVAHVD